MSFDTRYIGEYQTEIWRDLRADVTLWTSTEITRCVERAVDDLSRHYPLEAVYEHTIILDPPILPDYIVAPAAGTWKDLTYKPIEPGSDAVTSSPAGTTYTRDTDYTIDYANGRVTIVAAAQGGSITAGAPLLVDYTLSRLGIDISAIITNLIRVSRVEYPADRVPQQFVSYNIWNDFMYIGSQRPGESQTQLTDKEHVVIYYDAPHTAADATTAPSYPAFLDQVICIGAGAYALLMKAVQYEHQAVTDLASLRTSLVLVADYINEAHTKIGEMDTYVADTAGGGPDCAKDVLSNITDDISELRTAIGAALECADNFLDEVDTTDFALSTYGAEALIATGTPLINTVPVGARVAENYADYARACLSRAQARIAAAAGFTQMAVTRLSNIRSYIEESAGWLAIADRLAVDSAQRLAQGQTYIAQVSQYSEAAAADLALADRFRAEADERRNEVYSIWRDRKQYIGDFTAGSMRQMPRYKGE